jgi:hypothetical protein
VGWLDPGGLLLLSGGGIKDAVWGRSYNRTGLAVVRVISLAFPCGWAGYGTNSAVSLVLPLLPCCVMVGGSVRRGLRGGCEQ